jgi:membrane protein DedA with SNARE-associated domain
MPTAPNSLLAIFGALTGTALGLPIPEELTLLSAGYLAWTGAVSPLAVGLCALAGVACGDALLFLAGRLVGPRLARVPLVGRALTPARLERARGLLAGHATTTLLLARFLPGARSAIYFTAGLARMSLRRFLLTDLAAAGLSVSLWIGVGHHAGDHIGRLRAGISAASRHVPLALVGILAIYLVFRLARRGSARPERSEAPLRKTSRPVPPRAIVNSSYSL